MRNNTCLAHDIPGPFLPREAGDKVSHPDRFPGRAWFDGGQGYQQRLRDWCPVLTLLRAIPDLAPRAGIERLSVPASRRDRHTEYGRHTGQGVNPVDISTPRAKAASLNYTGSLRLSQLL